MPKDTSKGGPAVCPKCGQMLASASDLPRHKILHAPDVDERTKRCPYCPHRTLQKSNLISHIKSIHKIFLCYVAECEQEFTDSAALSTHERREHGISWQKKKSKQRERVKMISRGGLSTAVDQDPALITTSTVVPSQSAAPSPPTQHQTPLPYPPFSYSLAPPEACLRSSSAPPSTSYTTTASFTFPTPSTGLVPYYNGTTSTQSTPDLVFNLNNAGGAWPYSSPTVTTTPNLIVGLGIRSEGYLGVFGHRADAQEPTPLLSPPLSDLGSGSSISPSYSPYPPACNPGLGLGLQNLQTSLPAYPDLGANFQVTVPTQPGNSLLMQMPMVQNVDYFPSPDNFDPPAVSYDSCSDSGASRPIYFADLFGDQYPNCEM